MRDGMPGRPATQATLHQMNRAAVVRLIRQHGPVSRVQLSRLARLSKPTVSAVVTELLQEGLVREIGPGASAMGRKPILVEFASDSGVVVGVDLGVTKIRCMVADLDGTILRSTHHDLESVDAEAVLGSLVSCIGDALQGDHARLRTIVVGVPGVHEPRSGRVRLSPNLPRWGDIAVLSPLERAFQVPVILENDVNLAAIGEWSYGSARGFQNSIYVNLGAGLGAGIILDGRLYRGANGASGEIGFVLLDDPSTAPLDMAQGQLEGRAGGVAMRERALALLREPGSEGSKLASLDSGELSAKAVFDAAREGDALAASVVQDVASRLTRALVSMCVLFDPEILVLGGGLTRAGDILLRPITEGLRLYCPYPPQVTLSELEGDAEVRGAIAVAVQHVARVIEEPVD
ncbi:ROK family transcriptional regulator [Limnochorda pilosa]|uniref:ROK family transcriptional regulator n=1 Tax=Limnochorda pilosa TaxID=1555112 RepID=A0A0K2SGM0_LIMPI|nr:ROK family transcriptional regulator [Limnochorda pilosa]BAS26256.1 ROK family transcriptional regulator [Limnochorda pilosa]